MSMEPQKRHPKKKSGRGVIVVFIVLAAIIILCVAGGTAFLKFYRPSVDTDAPPFDIDVVGPGDTTANTGEETSDTTENSDDKYVRDVDSVNFLVVGRDKDAWNTDVMMIVNFNMREGSLSVLQIPRDTYIDTGDVHGRVNTMVKAMRQEAYYNDSSLSSSALVHAGMTGAVNILEKTLCIQIDGYAIVNLEGFRNIINAIGGVYMDVPYDMEYDDPAQELYIHLKKGPQVLNGAQAEMFVRYRAGFVQGDIGRVDSQKIFLTALFKQLKSNVKLSAVPELVKQLITHVTTDVPLADIIIYAKELLGVDMSNVSMMTLPGEDARSSTTGAWYYIMHRADVLTVINEYFNVYNKPVTDDMFDAEHAFTDESYSVFANIYFAEPQDITVENADSIDSDGIHIPMN